MATPWTNNDPIWANLTPQQRAAAMALMEAGRSKVPDAMNAASAMVNRSQKEGVPIGEHVSGAIYQPTIEPSQQARLPGIVKSPEFGQLTDYVKYRQSGDILDGTGGATHFLAKPDVMLGLEAQNPKKYHNWGPRGANWTGYDPATGQYSNQTFEDSSHAFLAPEGRADGSGGDPSGSTMADRLKNRVAQTQSAYDGQGNPVDVASGAALPTERTAQVQNGTMPDAQPAVKQPLLPMKPDETRAALNQALMDQALQSRPRTGLGAIGALAQYAAGMYGKNTEAEKAQEWKRQMRDAMVEAVNSGDRNKIISVMAQNPDTAGAAASAMLAQTGAKSAPTLHEFSDGSITGAKVTKQWDPKTGSWVVPGATPGAAPQQQQPLPTDEDGKPLTGDALIKAAGLSPSDASLVKGMASYSVPINQFRRLQQNAQLISMVEQYDPKFDAKEYKARQALQASFKSGKDAEEIKSYNTLTGHTARWNENIDALGNTGSPWLNAAINTVRGQYSTDFQAARGKINTDIDTAIAEYNRATTGKPITVEESKRWHDRVDESSAPAESKAVTEEFMHNVQSRMDSTAQKWNSGMGLNPGDPGYKTGMDLLYPDSRQRVDRLMGKGTVPAASSPASAEPARITSKADFDALPSGKMFIAPDGSTRVKP